MGAEIEKFQKEIEKANVEKIKAVDWSEKKKQVQSRRSASTDSLLSMDEGSDSSSNLPPPALPPKGRFVSSDNLSPSPPALPPKKNNRYGNFTCYIILSWSSGVPFFFQSYLQHHPNVL